MGSPRLRLLDPKATAVAGSLVLPLAVGSDVAGSLMIRTPLVTGNKLRYTDIYCTNVLLYYCIGFKSDFRMFYDTCENELRMKGDGHPPNILRQYMI